MFFVKIIPSGWYSPDRKQKYNVFNEKKLWVSSVIVPRSTGVIQSIKFVLLPNTEIIIAFINKPNALLLIIEQFQIC